MGRLRRGNVPSELTSFVGRGAELRQVRRSLESHPAVTLTGTGGVGKSRLARRAAAEVGRAFPDGVWFVELDDVADGALVPATVLGGLGLRDDGAPVEERLVEHLRPLRALLLLDGCERVAESCAALVSRLLAEAPGVRVLSTSRRPLRITGEAVLPVRPLPVPDLDADDLRPAALARCDAVALFADRAAAIRPDFALTEANAEWVARICHRLEGLPMAIEFAADRLDTLSEEQLAERLDDAERLLVTGKRGAPERQRTLYALVASSHSLCSPEEQALWARLAVFTGRFELGAVEQVCAGGPVAEDSVFDLVAGLVDKSVLTRDEHPGGTWYRLPRLLRDHARGHLVQPEEWLRLGERHAEWCLRLAEDATPGLLTPRTDSWAARIRGNHANIQSALAFCLTDGRDPSRALRLASSLWYYWLITGHVGEGRAWLERGLGASSEPSPERARALAVAADLAINDRDGAAATSLEAQLVAEQRQEQPALAGHLDFAGGVFATQRGDLVGARALFEKALEEFRASGDLMGTSKTLWHLALACIWSGDTAQGLCYTDEFTRTFGGQGDNWGTSAVHWALAHARLHDRDAAGALAAFTAGTALARRLEDHFGMTWWLQVGAPILALNGRDADAALMLGAARSHRVFALPALDLLRTRCSEDVRGVLGDRHFDELVARGARLPLEEAIGIALEGRPTDGDRPADGDEAATALSRREWEVAELVARGNTNKEIAATLVISTRTAEGHVRRILDKLGLASRAQIAAWMTGRRAGPAGGPLT
ncbi:ATP-binding protein [Streptomyces sp. NPDC050988]|uniref:ATP-binding protein n=1 Tax=Streptomyces sp. NPDC050988 TaxID=3365637 RepID=UPI00378A3CC6